MNKWYALLIVFVMLILSSCSASVSYQLKDDNIINIDYYASFTAGENISSYGDTIKAYWESIGLTTNKNDAEEKYEISGQKTMNCDSASQAAAEFASILTDENSLFYNISFTYTPSYFEDNYSLDAFISLEGVIRQTGNQDIPANEVDNILREAESGEYTLSIQLPGDVVSTNADNQSGHAAAWLLKYGELRRIQLETKIVFEDNIAHYAGLTQAQSRDNTLLLILGITGGALLLAIILTAVIRKLRRKISHI